jgi:holo-[acyl-carrier protein] synthase
MILGVGIDLAPVGRIERLLDRYAGRFAEKVFTDGERAYCRARARPAEHFAARFAAKEALLKALGVPEGLRWHELEVASTAGRAPRLLLHGEAARAASRRGVLRVHLSLTHAGGQAAAVVILEGEART